jgi:hypothetical protein
MSKIAAIDSALRLQLGLDGKQADYTAPLNGEPFNFDAHKLEKLLLNVAARLKADTPALTFDWTALDTARNRTTTLPMLIMQIEARTN